MPSLDEQAALITAHRYTGWRLAAEVHNRVKEIYPLPPFPPMNDLAAVITWNIQNAPILSAIMGSAVKAETAYRAWKEWYLVDPDTGAVLNIEYAFSPC